MPLFNAEEEQRISAAISAAERKTSGEIVAVIAQSSENYLYVPFLIASLVALFVPWPLMHLVWTPDKNTWIENQHIYLIQLLVFLILLAAIWPKRIRSVLVPRTVRAAHAKRRATEQFLAQNLHTTAGRTGVLIFVSVAERHAEILADKGIDERVPAGTWQEIVDRLTKEISEGRAAEGFVHAIDTAGKHLATHFPPGKIDPNELPDHLIILDN